MTHLCATYDLNQPTDRLAYCQQIILNGLRYWQKHPAVVAGDDTVFDRERDGILNALSRGLEFDPAWVCAGLLQFGLLLY